VGKELSQYVFVSESQNYKVNFTMFLTTRDGRQIDSRTCSAMVLIPSLVADQSNVLFTN
jgi:hypothetical protein